MRNYELSTPNAAERYFNHSIFGQLYTLIAEALGSRRRDRPRSGHSAEAEKAAPASVRDLPRLTWLDRVDAWFWRQAQKDREAYLARSRDMFELERRIEALDRGGLARYGALTRYF